jgi:hypothetical protein
METSWGHSLWRQFNAAIDMLDHAIIACPPSLWEKRVWPEPPRHGFPPQFGEYWYVAFHTMIWLDLYLSGASEEEFIPPVPFIQGEVDSLETTPEHPYIQEELRTYLVSVRQKCRDSLVMLTDDRARRPVEYPWTRRQPVSYMELQLYNMRHVQEHAAQLSLFLGQHASAEVVPGWVSGTKDAISSS